jgi:phospholipase C
MNAPTEALDGRIGRRDFLRGALGVSGLALLNGAPVARALVGPSVGTLPNPKESGLDVIVVGMMENRSTDHFLGWLPGINGIQQGFSNPRALAEPRGDCPGARPLPVVDRTPVRTFHLTSHCQLPDPDHGWNGSRVELNHGRMNGFVDRSGPVAMGYYKEADVPFLAWLARNYNTFSRYHSSVMGPTFPNREYLHSGQAGGVRSNELPAPTPENPVPNGYTWPTIWERLEAAGVEWAYYGSDLPTIGLWFHLVREHPGRVRHITDYFIDAEAGVLPNVTFIDPSFYVVGNDDHPAHDIKLGQRFMMDTFLALAEGPQWRNAAYILTYDEHGGFYDHVRPPRAPDQRASSHQCDDWGQLGFRVPTILASPFSRRGVVGQKLYDHTSILKLIEWRFRLRPLTRRDAWARNLGEILDFEHPHPNFHSQPPFIPLHEAGAACAFEQIPEAFAGENPLEPLPDIPVPPLGSPQPHAELVRLADEGFFGHFDMRDRARAGVFRT